MKLTIPLLLLLTVTINGCGEFAYKQGATPRDLEQAKKTCESIAKNANAEQTKAATECLEQQGWTVKNLDDDDLFATASYSNSNPNQTPDQPHKYAAENTADSTAADSNESARAADTSKTENKNVKVNKPEPNPLDIYIINSWWKMGGNGQKMEADIDACVASLGEAHKPNKKTQEVTRGLILCMREKGWMPLKAR